MKKKKKNSGNSQEVNDSTGFFPKLIELGTAIWKVREVISQQIFLYM